MWTTLKVTVVTRAETNETVNSVCAATVTRNWTVKYLNDILIRLHP